LGVEVPNDADGVLQDIHWSAGLFGYFPTYSLGNLYAAQFFEQADQELGGLAARMTRGEFTWLRRWLNEKIHKQGRRYSAAALCERITGKSLSHEPLMRHLRSKYELLYAPTAASLDGLDVPRDDVAGDGVGTAVGEPETEAGYGVVGGEAAGDFGFGVAPMAESAATFSTGTAKGSVAAPAYRRKKEGGLLTAVILLAGIVGGGIIGTSLGYWILLWWKGPPADFLKIRDKLPGWLVPAYEDPDAMPEPIPVVPPRPAQPGSAAPGTSARAMPDVGRSLTRLVLQAARERTNDRAV
jgi:hypothetical protein